MSDLNARIKQLTKLILTSQSVDESRGDESRPASPAKIDFDMSPYQVGPRARVKSLADRTARSYNKNYWLRDVTSRHRRRRSCHLRLPF